MTAAVTINGTITEAEGWVDRFNNDITGLPSAISTELNSAIAAAGVVKPTLNDPPGGPTYFSTYAEKDGIVSITGAVGTASAFFSDANGALLNGTDSGHGTGIFLYTSPSDPKIIYGIAQSGPGIKSGTPAFALVLQGTFDPSGSLTGNFLAEQCQPIHAASASNTPNDVTRPAGATLFVSATQELAAVPGGPPS